MERSPLVSVVLPLYNGERFVADTVRSVLAQTWQNWELIVVNDASTDGSEEIIRSFDDPRIRLISLSQNGQLCHAHNVANEAAKGAYIATIDRDDQWLPEKLEKQVAFMEAHPETGVCFTLVSLIDESGAPAHDETMEKVFAVRNKSREEWLHDLLLTGNHLCHPSSLVRKTALDEAGPYDVRLLQVQDYDLWLRILRNHDIHVIPEPLTLYRRFGESGALSTQSRTNMRRVYLEQGFVTGETVLGMEDDLFLRVFHRELKDPEAKPGPQTLCEKALLLQANPFEMPAAKAFAFRAFGRVFSEPEAAEIMRAVYHVTQHDVYRLSAEPIFYDPVARAELQDQSARADQQTALALFLQNKVDEASATANHYRNLEEAARGELEQTRKQAEATENHLHNLLSGKESELQQTKDHFHNLLNSKENELQQANAEAQATENHLHNLLTNKESELQQTKDHYQNLLEINENEKRASQAQLTETQSRLKAAEDRIEAYVQHVVYLNGLHEQEVNAVKAELGEMTARYEKASSDFLQIQNSFFWRLTAPFRKTIIAIRKAVLKWEGLHVALFVAKNTLRHGPKDAMRRYRQYVIDREMVEIRAMGYPEIDPEAFAAQRAAKFPKDITFSILVPLYNTPENFLTAMIQSVQHQTYAKWELCLADGSDAEHPEVGKLCRKMARKDRRIRYRKLERNLGISGNTNACIDLARGNFLALFDHDDLLHPFALYEDMKAICDQDADFIYTDENTFHDVPSDAFNPHFKPDFAPDTLRANNYICHFTVFDRALLEPAGGGFRSEYDGSQDFDIVLRLTEQAKKIVHIPKVLYYWRAHRGSVAESVGAKPYVIDAAKNAIREHLKRVGLKGDVLDSMVPSMYRLKYEIEGNPLVSIVIPSCDHSEDLKRCLDSIFEKSTWKNFEIIVVENNSREKETFDYYRQLRNRKKVRIVKWGGIFNFSAICNFGVRHAKGQHILLLNNDVEIISPDWLQEMLMYSQRKDIGAVGAKLYYPDHTIQHAGIGIGILTLAGHYHKHFDGNHPGYMGRLIYAQDLSAVTGACMMIRREVYDQLNGYDESFEVAFNDVDFCMRVRQAGYLIVFTPFAELYHYESKSRGQDEAPEKRARFVGEVTRFQERWKKELAAGDPYFNPNFSLDREDFSIRQQ